MSPEKYDCILIPGGGLSPDGSLPAWVKPRLARALALEKQTRWLIPLSAGTTHKPPPLDGEGFPIYESRAAADYLVQSGIDPARILIETCSYDTIGNAYFSRTLFCDPLGLARCHIVTSQFHLARVQAAFQWVFSLTPGKENYQLSFEGTPDQGLAPSALQARQEKEKTSLRNLREMTGTLKTLAEFQRWLFSEHQAYAARRAARPLTPDELSSY